jgi:hypothetical protein
MVGTGLIGLAIFASIFVTAFMPSRGMPSLEKRLRFVLVATLLIGLAPRTWDYRKPLWLIFGVFAAQGAVAYAPKAVGVRVPALPSRREGWETGLVKVQA